MRNRLASQFLSSVGIACMVASPVLGDDCMTDWHSTNAKKESGSRYCAIHTTEYNKAVSQLKKNGVEDKDICDAIKSDRALLNKLLSAGAESNQRAIGQYGIMLKPRNKGYFSNSPTNWLEAVYYRNNKNWCFGYLWVVVHSKRACFPR